MIRLAALSALQICAAVGRWHAPLHPRSARERDPCVPSLQGHQAAAARQSRAQHIQPPAVSQPPAPHTAISAAERGCMPHYSGAGALRGHGGIVNAVVPLSGGDLVVTTCADRTVRAFSTASCALVHKLKGGWAFRLAALGGDVFALLVADVGLLVWDARLGECLYEWNLAERLTGIAALGTDGFVVSTGDDLFYFQHRNGRDVTRVRRGVSGQFGNVLGISACGGRLATAPHYSTVSVWDVGTLERLAALNSDSGSDFTAIAMGDQWVVTAEEVAATVNTSENVSVRVYDARTFRCARVLEHLHSHTVTSLAIVGVDYLLSASCDGTVCLSDLTAGALVSRMSGCVCRVFCAAFTRDGRIAVSGSGGAALHSAPAEFAPVISCHNSALTAAAHPGLALRAIRAIEAGADPSTLRRALAGRRLPGR
jgi:hypothetical protein